MSMSKLKKKQLLLEEQIKSMGYVISNLQNEDYKRCTYDFKTMLQSIDAAQFISRYKWTGLPEYMPANVIEKMLYYKGTLCGFFYQNQLYILPYAIDGPLNVYGYATAIKPIGYNGTSFDNLKLNTYPNGTLRKYANAVILNDRPSDFMGSTCLPMSTINSDIIDLMNDTLKRSELSSISSLKKFLIQTADGKSVEGLRADMRKTLLSDDPFYIMRENSVVVNGLRSDVATLGTENETDKIIQYYSSLNNQRCYNMGIKNNGVFEKMERVVVGELTGNEYQTNLILETGLTMRKSFLESLKEIYPEQRAVLDKIKVEINIEPYIAKVQNNNINGDIEKNMYVGGVENDEL